jgi:hypothetical protein
METADGTALDHTAHYYMECSNKGICDRKSGECECFDGYEGSSCQRASCPNACSGHGTCETIKELAEDEFDNIYALWDKDISMGCACDPGYSGADCSSRLCKYGIDPLYIDDESTARVATATYIVRPYDMSTGYVTDGLDGAGTYAIKFYDVFGEDYDTAPILASDDTTCLEVVTALESLPNTVIPGGSVFCSDFYGNFGDLLGSYDFEATSKNFHMYSLTFTGNPGYLKPIEIDTHLDGQRPTSFPNMSVWSDGMTGEFTDYFATQCELVYAKISPLSTAGLNGYGKLTDLTTVEEKYLKKCLGDSDGYSSNNIEVYDWDWGTPKETEETESAMGGTPHVIKLVKRYPNNDYDGGKYAVIWYDGSDFIVATKASDVTSEYAIFTTDGTAERVYFDTDSDSTFETSESAITAKFEQFSNTLYTSHDASCETGDSDGEVVEPCLDKGDLIFLTDANWGTDGSSSYNSAYDSGFSDTTDLYTITKIWKSEETYIDKDDDDVATDDMFRITVDKSINWVGATGSVYTGYKGYVQIIKFTPASSGNYEYVSMCSNRGLCDGDEGLCECFKGYTNDNCNMQSSLAV